MKSNGTPRDREAEGLRPIDRFLSQPAYHAVEDSENKREADDQFVGPRRSFWQSVRHFLFEKSASEYSSISPRTADGRRTKIFPFNGNGRGR
jgi:hypothetical protein